MISWQTFATAVGSLIGTIRLLLVTGRWTPVVVQGRQPVWVAKGKIVLGRRVRSEAAVRKSEIGAGAGGTLSVGDGTNWNQGCTIVAAHSIRIGNVVMIGDGCSITDSSYHEVDSETPVRLAEVVIEDNVWLGRGVTVLAGVTIGKGSVIAAGSVVTRDVPAGVLAAGSPAKVIKELVLAPGWIRSEAARDGRWTRVEWEG